MHGPSPTSTFVGTVSPVPSKSPSMVSSAAGQIPEAWVGKCTPDKVAPGVLYPTCIAHMTTAVIDTRIKTIHPAKNRCPIVLSSHIKTKLMSIMEFILPTDKVRQLILHRTKIMTCGIDTCTFWNKLNEKLIFPETK